MNWKILISIPVILSACSRNNMYEEAAESGAAYDYVENANGNFVTEGDVKVGTFKNAGYSGDQNAEQLPTQQKLIRTGELSIRVDDYARDVQVVKEAIKKFNGYIGDEVESREAYRLGNSLNIRIPEKNFDAFVDDMVKGHGFLNIDRKQIHVQDVGEEYADLEARIIAKKAVEQQYLEILKQAKTVQDILDVREKLRVVREEIESHEGRVRYLANQIQYSTIQLEIYQLLEYGTIEKPGFWNKVKNSLSNGWQGLVNFIIGIISMWPGILIVIGIIWLFRRWRKRRRAARS